ncbi:Uncharacterised protein [Mycobacteroides abscessus subsp. massiliense]|nr:Uncharacterised protein [Mycobacteroides abscessus subsp. massiliense]
MPGGGRVQGDGVDALVQDPGLHLLGDLLGVAHQGAPEHLSPGLVRQGVQIDAVLAQLRGSQFPCRRRIVIDEDGEEGRRFQRRRIAPGLFAALPQHRQLVWNLIQRAEQVQVVGVLDR